MHLFALLGLLAWTLVMPQARAATLFDTREFRAETHAALPQWRRVLAEINDEIPGYNACALDAAKCASNGVMAWHALLQALREAPVLDQIKEINSFANQWPYQEDSGNYGRSDYWATPMSFLAQSGDCEDYAIFKYVSLRRLGLPSSALRLVVLQDTLRDLPHAVLAVYVEDEIYILDNVTDAVLEHRRLTHYLPFYSVNENARWTHLPADRNEQAISLLSASGRGSER